MLSFPQFTRSTLCGEFTWVGAIIFEGNFTVREQFSGGRAVFLGGNCPMANCLESNCPEENFPQRQLSLGAIVLGVNCPGAIIREGNNVGCNYPGANFPRVELSGHQISHLFIWSFHNYRRSSLQLFCKIGVSQYSQKNIWARASFFKYSCRPATIFTKKGSYTYWKRCSDIGVFLTIFNNNFFNI